MTRRRCPCRWLLRIGFFLRTHTEAVLLPALQDFAHVLQRGMAIQDGIMHSGPDPFRRICLAPRAQHLTLDWHERCLRMEIGCAESTDLLDVIRIIRRGSGGRLRARARILLILLIFILILLILIFILLKERSILKKMGILILKQKLGELIGEMEPILDMVDIVGIIVDIILELADIVIISVLAVIQEPISQVIEIQIYLNKKKMTQIKLRIKIQIYLILMQVENQVQILNKIKLKMAMGVIGLIITLV